LALLRAALLDDVHAKGRMNAALSKSPEDDELHLLAHLELARRCVNANDLDGAQVHASQLIKDDHVHAGFSLRRWITSDPQEAAWLEVATFLIVGSSAHLAASPIQVLRPFPDTPVPECPRTTDTFVDVLVHLMSRSSGQPHERLPLLRDDQIPDVGTLAGRLIDALLETPGPAAEVRNAVIKVIHTAADRLWDLGKLEQSAMLREALLQHALAIGGVSGPA
jgi:hypothetical protein